MISLHRFAVAVAVALASLVPAAPALAVKPPAKPAATQPTAPTGVHQFRVKRLDGTAASLASYRGRVMLIVNTASKCGLTPQYAGLEKLHDAYAAKGLAVLGFPANDFFFQEPGSNAEIAEFCTENYGVSFDMFEKVAVKGRDQAPLYAYLTGDKAHARLNGPISWNFEKFLVNRHGAVVARFAPRTQPTDPEVIRAIEAELARP